MLVLTDMYGVASLLLWCARSLRSSSPARLVSLQKKQWDSLMTFFKKRYACQFNTTHMIEAPTQPASALHIERLMLDSLSNWELAALDALTTVTKSFLISWSVLCDYIDVSAAYDAARLEENYQMDQYGRVDGIYGHGIDIEFTKMTIAAAKLFHSALNPTPHNNPFLRIKDDQHAQQLQQIAAQHS